MAEFTENYNLIKPSEEDYYDVQDFNENMDTIDAQMAETEAEIEGLGQKLDGIDAKIGENEENQTIFDLLKKTGGVKLYQPSETVQYEIGETVLVPTGSEHVNGKYKLGTFHAKHNGMIRIYLKNTNSAGTSTGEELHVYDFVSEEYITTPNMSAFSDIKGIGTTPVYKAELSTLGFDGSLYIPVSAGKIYTFILMYVYVTYFTLNSFQICYDVVDVEEIAEVAA